VSGTPAIALFDKDPIHARILEKELAGVGRLVFVCAGEAHCQDLISSQEIAMLIADVAAARTSRMDMVAWARQAFPNIRIVAMADSDSYSLELQSLARGADVYLSKPAPLEVIIRLLHEEALADSFSGQVEGVDIIELLQFMMWAGKSSVLEITSHSGAKGEIFVRNAEVIHARCGDMEGELALYRCLSFRGGVFSSRPWRAPDKETIAKPGEFLLVEGARTRDEIRRTSPDLTPGRGQAGLNSRDFVRLHLRGAKAPPRGKP
jgi:CheY-like chemotaxis protein